MKISAAASVTASATHSLKRKDRLTPSSSRAPKNYEEKMLAPDIPPKMQTEKNKNKLVGYRHPRHLHRAQRSDHHVVEHVHEHGDAVLYHDGQSHREHHHIKGPVPYVFFKSDHKSTPIDIGIADRIVSMFIDTISATKVLYHARAFFQAFMTGGTLCFYFSIKRCLSRAFIFPYAVKNGKLSYGKVVYKLGRIFEIVLTTC
jgi:hypothetical protein